MFSEFRLYIRYCGETRERLKRFYAWNRPEKARGPCRGSVPPPRHREGLAHPPPSSASMRRRGASGRASWRAAAPLVSEEETGEEEGADEEADAESEEQEEDAQPVAGGAAGGPVS